MNINFLSNFLSNKSLRIDRLLTIGIGKKLGKLTTNYSDLRIPILMYHSISNEVEKVRHPYFKTSTSPRVFAEHMKFLQENHYVVISLAEAVDIITRKPQPVTRNHSLNTRNPVVLTFDDGFADFNTEAFPILQEYGFCATVFLPTGFISEKRGTFKGIKCLSWEEVQNLAASGVQFGSHTITHRKMRELSWDQIDREIKESKKSIEDRIGTSAASFSYPYAFPEEEQGFKTRLRISLVETGYTNGVTTIIGTATEDDDRLFLRRIPVNSDDDTNLFRAKLAGSYDWVHGLQRGFKLIRQILGTKKGKTAEPPKGSEFE